MTISPDLAFQAAANRADAIFTARPAFVSYRVRTQLAIPSLRRNREIDRLVITRTADDASLITDLPQGGTRLLSHAFPFAPTFDALSYFNMSYGSSLGGRVSFALSSVQPLHFEAPVKTDADVLVVSLRAYRVRYAPDSTTAVNGETHLLLHPYHYVKTQAPPNSIFFREVRINNATGLPSFIAFSGDDDRVFTCNYSLVTGYWAIDRAHFEQTLHGPLHVGRIHLVADAEFDQVRYAATSPVADLQPSLLQPSPIATTMPTIPYPLNSGPLAPDIGTL